MGWDIAVKALVMCLEAQEVRRRACCRSGALSEPINVGLVIGSGPNGSFANVGTLCDDIVMGDIAAEFKIAVVDRAVGVVKGNNVVLNRGGERLTPQERLRGVVVVTREEEDAPHTGTGGVASPNDGRHASRDELGDASRARSDVSCEQAKIVKQEMNVRGETNPRAVRLLVTKSFL